MSSYLFSSESVSEGHPDKMADLISDAVLDELISKDAGARVACETLVKTGMVLVAGEINTNAWVDIEHLVRQIVLDIGYDSSAKGFDGSSCSVLNVIGKQSPEISAGVDRADSVLGAGDQGIMFGYACRETEELMPLPISLAHALTKQQANVRKSGELPWLCPDAKAQVTCRYENGMPVSVDAVVLSTQHTPDVDQKTLQEGVKAEIIERVIPAELLHSETKFWINPTGSFIIGGPQGDCGLTGRKIIVDTYGGMARHGGGAFSGKDPSKVDRSAAYMARYIAKNIVSSGLADKCEVQLAYAIGVSEPVSIYVNTFGTQHIPESAIPKLVTEHFSLTPQGIIDSLDLIRPIYKKTTNYGHFGRAEPELTWEKTDKADALRQAAGLPERAKHGTKPSYA